MNSTDFGYKKVSLEEKTKLVSEVFHSVASRYDVMNDVMSLGIHRYWKKVLIDVSLVHAGDRVLDLAGGTGDLSIAFSKRVGKMGEVILADINSSMLKEARKKLIDRGVVGNVKYEVANAEVLPFENNFFDCIVIAFGLRNVTDKDKALRSIFRVLKPGGRLLILEFSKPTSEMFQKIYDTYSFNIIPQLGKWIAQDETSYRYLVESIRMYPDQIAFLQMMEEAGFEDCDYQNLTGGIVALHKGYKF